MRLRLHCETDERENHKVTAAATHIWDLIRNVPAAERIASAAHVTAKRGSPATAFVIAGEGGDELLASFEQFSDDRWEWRSGSATHSPRARPS